MKELKSYVIDSISSMNINLLDVLIEDNSIIHNSLKEVWLDKFNILFNYFKNYEINQLNIRAINELDKSSFEVLFYNNDINKPFYFKLRFTCTDLYLIDIVQIPTTLILDEKEVTQIFEIKLLFFKDDLVDFNPSIKYHKDVTPYKDALEIFWPRLNDVIVTHDQIVMWLDDNVDLYDNLNPQKLLYKYQYYFFRLYNFFNDLENCLDQDNEYETANDEFLQLDKNNLESLKNWFYNNEHLYLDVKCLDNYQIPKGYFVLGSKRELVKVNYEFNILTYAAIYNNIIQFKLNIESIAHILQIIDPALEDY